jgi:hypothetical protein
MLVIEAPYIDTRGFSSIAFLARKNNQYIRPIVGNTIDLRTEDWLPPPTPEEITNASRMNLVGRLPDVSSMGQVDRYLLATASTVERTNLTRPQAMEYIAKGYTELPDSPNSKLWEYSKSPWWEYVAVFDTNGRYIKAPKIPRVGEMTPEDIDEKLDDYEQNKNKLQVTSPTTLEELSKRDESYVDKLKKI